MALREVAILGSDALELARGALDDDCLVARRPVTAFERRAAGRCARDAADEQNGNSDADGNRHRPPRPSVAVAASQAEPASERRPANTPRPVNTDAPHRAANAIASSVESIAARP